MTDLAREKYARLMTEVEDLEDQADALEKKLQAAKKPSSKSAAKWQAQLLQIQEELGHKRTELTRISDGCGKPHAMN